jgi:hypothetical protein
MVKKNPGEYIPEEEEVLSELKKGERRPRGYSVSSTITGRGTHSANFKSEVEARSYMKGLRDSAGTKLIRCKLIPMY